MTHCPVTKQCQPHVSYGFPSFKSLGTCPGGYYRKHTPQYQQNPQVTPLGS